jgi:outer membrane receptor for ferrienterochelin and colicins
MDMAPVVVTATRSERRADDLAVPVSILDRATVASQGAARLTGLLADQPGLSINTDHGAGLQMRGLGPEYTLVLVDGEPVIGRTAGTLDLDRLTTANVERVEILRGPTSSLYGSSALAGVVNLITERPAGRLDGRVRSRYGTHGTVDLSARIGGSSGPWRGSVFVNRYRTGGYDLSPGVLSPTRPGYVDYTAQARGQADVGPKTTLSLRGRLAAQGQDYDVGVSERGGPAEVRHTQSADRLDWNVSAALDQGLGTGWTLTGTLYGSGYHTDQTLRRTSDGAVRSSTALDQHYGEGEVLLRGALGGDHFVTVGGGTVLQAVDADRKKGRRLGAFALAQDEWSPSEAVDVTGSVRFDANSDYASRLSPKLSVRYAPSGRLSLRASVGSGYKAPAFRQLYLDFTNPQAGYTVLGVTKAKEGLERLRQQGRIQAAFPSRAGLGTPLKPETSIALNAGLTARLWAGAGPRQAQLQVDLYHNEVDNLIDTEAIARRTNGQSVFTYVNRREVFTRGVEARLDVRPAPGLRVQLGYDYLQARDRQVVRALEEGTVYRRENGRDVRVSASDYGGLPGRAAHSGTVQVRYTHAPLGLTAGIQGTLRGRAGYADRNGNGIVDVGREYVEARTLWDATLSKTVLDDYTVRVGGENLLGYTNPSRVPSLPGRTWFVEMQARF